MQVSYCAPDAVVVRTGRGGGLTVGSSRGITEAWMSATAAARARRMEKQDT